MPKDFKKHIKINALPEEVYDALTKPFAIEYFDDFETAKSFAADFMYGFLYISCIDNDGRLLWLDIDIEDCDGECDTCKHRRTVPGTDERIDREPCYYCDKEA